MHAYTYCASSGLLCRRVAELDIIEKEDFRWQAAKREGTAGRYALALVDHRRSARSAGWGLMCGIELVQDKATKAEFPAEEKIGVKVHAAAMKRGLFSRLRGDVYCLAPPIVTPTATLDRIVDVLRESVAEVLG